MKEAVRRVSGEDCEIVGASRTDSGAHAEGQVCHFDASVPITLNTDDPALFRTTLNGEYRLAMEQFGFTEAEIRQIAANAFRYKVQQQS